MSKIKNKDEFKERDEIEEYFSEVKNRSFPTGIIFIFLLLLITGGISYYYFIIDNPKNIFLTLINNKINNLEKKYISYDKINYEFNLDTNIETTNKKHLDTINIINNIAVSGTGGVDLNINKSNNNLQTFYKGEKLITLDVYSELDKNIYLKSNEIFDKVIKVSIDNSNNKEINNNYNINKNNLKDLYNSLSNIFKSTLKEANYQKKYTKLNDNLVKKITLIIDKKFKEEFYNKLLNNNEFLNSFSKINGITKNELEENINKELDKLNNDIETISLYVSILENEFISLEVISNNDRLILNKENNKYNYKIYDDDIIEYQGNIEIIKTNNSYEFSITHEDIENNLNINLNLDLTLKYDEDISKLEIIDAIEYKDLTEKDINKIISNIDKLSNIKRLIEDIQTLSNSKNKETTE